MVIIYMSRPAERRVSEAKGIEHVVLGKKARAGDWICPTALLFNMVWCMAGVASLKSWSEVQNLRLHPKLYESESAF